MKIDDQISHFENRLAAQLPYALFVNVNLDYWEELDELDTGSIKVMNDIIDEVFTPIDHVYHSTRLKDNLMHCRDVLKYALVSSMNVPFPRDPILHVHRVVENIRDIFMHCMHPKMRDGMILIDHHACVIQRVWRRAISDPSRRACRRRLEHEFNRMSMA